MPDLLTQGSSRMVESSVIPFVTTVSCMPRDFHNDHLATSQHCIAV